MAGKVGRPPGGKKYGGRKKGTPNKVTTEVKEVLKEAFFKTLNSMDLEAMEDKDKIAFMGKILPYFASQAKDTGGSEKLTINLVRED